MPDQTNGAPRARTHVRVVRSDNREFPSMAIAYRTLIGTAEELGMSEHQRIRSEIRSGGSSRDRHGFTWRAAHGFTAVPVDAINWTDFTFGVELELYTPNATFGSDEFAARAAMQDRLARLGASRWKVVRDGSLGYVSGFMPMEVVSPILQGTEGLVAMKQVMDMVREAGCRVNNQCGLHVHVGVRGMSPQRVRKIALAFLNAEHHFDSIVPPSRRNNRYALSNTARAAGRSGDLANAGTIRSITDVMNGGNSNEHYNSFRYYKLNFQSFVHHGTIEFRQHAGSVESAKACAWVRLITGFCAAAASDEQAVVLGRSTQPSFEDWLGRCTDQAGREYFVQRRAKFEAAAARVAA
jgi:hypothetical protein